MQTSAFLLHTNARQKFMKNLVPTGFESVKFFKFFLCMYFIQHCFICRPSDSTVSEDAGIEPRTVATAALAVRRSSHSATSHPLSETSHPLSETSHPLSATSHPRSATSHPHSATSHPQLATSHPLKSVKLLIFSCGGGGNLPCLADLL